MKNKRTPTILFTLEQIKNVQASPGGYFLANDLERFYQTINELTNLNKNVKKGKQE